MKSELTDANVPRIAKLAIKLLFDVDSHGLIVLELAVVVLLAGFSRHSHHNFLGLL